jgi:hypothetical protein
LPVSVALPKSANHMRLNSPSPVLDTGGGAGEGGGMRPTAGSSTLARWLFSTKSGSASEASAKA